MLKDLYSLKGQAISQEDLNKILGSHEHYCAQKGGARATLHGVNLEGLVLANRNLSEADLSGSSLARANLYGSNLTRASLYCTNLCDCDLRNARLVRADLRGASFKGADLSFAAMDFADLRAATLMYVGDKFRVEGNIHDDRLFGAVDFSNCSLRNASFGNARLANANFSNAMLNGAQFRGAKLDNACFEGAILIGVQLQDLKVPPETLSNCLLEPTADAVARAGDILAKLKAHHEWMSSGGRSGETANLDGEDLRPVGKVLKQLCLSGLSARNTIAVGVDFSGCELQGAKFDDADLRGANFQDTDLSGSSFDRAKLAHANFRNAVIQDLVLYNGGVLPARAEKAQAIADQFGDAKIGTPAFVAGLGLAGQSDQTAGG